MTVEEKGREKAIQRYRILAGLYGLLGIGLLVCGILGAVNKDEDEFGPPYFLGGFIVGILTLLAAVICASICLKAPNANDEIKKKEIGCAIQGQYILAMFTVMGCFMGCVFAGISGLGSSNSYGDEEENDGKKKTLAIVILVGCILAIFLTIFSMSIVCTYSSYFGVVMTRGRRGRMVMINTGGSTAMPTSTNPTIFQTTTTHVNNEHINQLEAQNRLLQQQLELQKQLQQQQQQQQQQQSQYSGGFYPPPPPPPTYGFGDSAYPPTAPPPSYNDAK